MSPEQFVTATAALDWSTLDDLQAHLVRCGYWDGVQADLFGMIERPDGEYVWKQEVAFTKEDYEVVIAYCV